MSFYTALSGLKAAQTDLGVIANNVANVGTTAFKRSDTEFADLVSSSPMQSSGTPGQGTRLRSISQQFTQGGLETSERSLDLAISGQGFFVTRAAGASGQLAYTRNGSFSVDKNRYLTDSSGAYLQVLPTDAAGTVTSSGITATRAVQLPLTSGTAAATSAVDLAVTFPSAADVPSARAIYASPATYAFDRDDPNSYNQSTTTTVYDGSGQAFPMTTYYTRENIPSGATTTTSWTARTFIGDKEVSYDASAATQPAPLTLTFDASGAKTAPTGSATIAPVNPDGASAPISFTVNYGTATKQASAPFTMTSFNQDGFAPGQLDSLSIGKDGMISATFSNGDVQSLGKIAIANFANPEGLRQLGDSKWTSTGNSGEVMISEANTSGAGAIQSGALEQANVDITAELVALIQAQRNFSANAKTIEAANTMTTTIVNLRS